MPTRRLYVLQKHAAGQVSSKRKSDRHDAANKKQNETKKNPGYYGYYVTDSEDVCRDCVD